MGLASLGNAAGRVFWAWISDLITRRATFFVMFVLQVLLFWFLPNIATASLITIVTFAVLMCYGGGFGTMPAFTADYFGPKNVGPIYGLMLTAWGFASAFGPLLFHDTKRVIALIGIKDVVIVDTPDALLVTTKEHAQRVKGAVDALKASGDTDVL